MSRQGIQARGTIGNGVMSRTRARLPALRLALAIVLLAARQASGASVVLTPAKDNTLYEDPNGAFSNGAGPNFFVGRVSVISGGTIRRAVLAFDVAGGIPAGSTIVSVTLTLNMSKTVVGLEPVSLHRLLADWGEGTSVGSGGGALSTSNDATWIHRFFNTVFWTNPGGDFVASPSATIQVGPIGQYTWLSTPGMVADVQAWADNPGSNFGWILVGNETTFPTSKRFDSRENLTPSVRPMLTVEYTAGTLPAGRVPDGGEVPGPPLTVEQAAGGGIRLTWGSSCNPGDTDSEIYTGTLGDFTRYGPALCTTGGLTLATLAPSAPSQFFLVVPRNASREGSYGTNSAGAERPPGTGACLPQSFAACP